MPSVLVETGFLTNKKEGAYLNSSNGQKKMANAIAQAVVTYKSKLNFDDNEVILEEETTPVVVADQIFEDVIFKVQLAASSRKLALKSYNFKGLGSLSRKQEGNLYKYFYGSTSNYTEIQRMLTEAKEKGYNTAFIVSFTKNNIQIPLKQVLN